MKRMLNILFIYIGALLASCLLVPIFSIILSHNNGWYNEVNPIRYAISEAAASVWIVCATIRLID